MPFSHINPKENCKSLISVLKAISCKSSSTHSMMITIQRLHSRSSTNSSVQVCSSVAAVSLYVQISVGTMASFVPTEGMRLCSDRKSRGNWTRKPRILRSSSWARAGSVWAKPGFDWNCSSSDMFLTKDEGRQRNTCSKTHICIAVLQSVLINGFKLKYFINYYMDWHDIYHNNLNDSLTEQSHAHVDIETFFKLLPSFIWVISVIEIM